MKALLRIEEFQEAYGVSRSTVYRLAESGHISFVKIGRATRISVEEADRWFESLRAVKLG